MKPPISPSINFLDVLNNYKNLVWSHIKTNLNQVKDFPDFCRIDPKYRFLVDFHFDMVSDYPRRKGKYLRPSLVLLTAQAMGFDINKAIPTASAMQISEDWILSHDDIEDQSEQRRGLPAIQKIYGNELAINAGDALHVLMWQVLSQNYSILDKNLAQKIHQEFFTMINRTILGQTIEIKWTQDNRFDLTEEDLLLILESKTGYYTIAGPMRLGAILAGATDSQLESIYCFGVMLGRSFQIIDDLLDLTSDFGGQKKQQGNDIYEGKRTIMLVHLLNHIDSASKIKLQVILLKPRDQKTESEINWVIDQMKNFGSLDYGRQLANKFSQEATKIFETELQFLSHQPFRSQILSGIDFITNRNQ
ncbi:MAG: polyprenyl synthetase family protein [Candidatus Shapirobacteria bacterium]|nr:polyprenyl synthetase family protein [Candidatus Shapirobacteria bacterium]